MQFFFSSTLFYNTIILTIVWITFLFWQLNYELCFNLAHLLRCNSPSHFFYMLIFFPRSVIVPIRDGYRQIWIYSKLRERFFKLILLHRHIFVYCYCYVCSTKLEYLTYFATTIKPSAMQCIDVAVVTWGPLYSYY